MPDVRRTRLYKQQSRQPCGTSGFAFPHTRRLRVLLRRASLGIRTGVHQPRAALSTRHAVETGGRAPVRPRKHTTSAAHLLRELKQLGDIRRDPARLRFDSNQISHCTTVFQNCSLFAEKHD
jgi:hypothetical protein